jgi:hypothetical protein
MGYLDNSTVTVDAILTNKGRQILANGGQLAITKFALSDDEVDYDLWNPSHTLGSNYYGKVIEDMPILEALPDETQMMRYKLVTLPKESTSIPVVSIASTTTAFTNLNQTVTFTPASSTGYNSTLGYTAILSDDTFGTLEVAPGFGVTGVAADSGNVTTFIDDEVGVTTAGKSITKVGKAFTVAVNNNLTTAKSALLTIVANETGGFKTITLTAVATANITPR